VKGDGRSRRAAIVSDAVLNAAPGVLGAIADAGWGVIALPPATLGEPAFGDWVAGAVDQARELARHGMTVVAVLDAGDEPARAALQRAMATEPALELAALVAPLDDARAIATFLERHRAAPGS
jgi:hypothetical protein